MQQPGGRRGPGGTYRPPDEITAVLGAGQGHVEQTQPFGQFLHPDLFPNLRQRFASQPKPGTIVIRRVMTDQEIIFGAPQVSVP